MHRRDSVATVLSLVVVAASIGGPAPAFAQTPAHDGFVLASGDGAYSLRLGGMFNLRVDHVRHVDGSQDTEVWIQRARVSMKGTVLSEALTYGAQMELAGTPGLLDYYLDYAVVSNELHVRAGQWRTPFTRQWNTPITQVAFVDRSLADDAFGQGREIGVALHNGYTKAPPWEWSVGLFGGTEAARGALRPTIVARVAYNHGGIDAYSETDMDGGPFRVAVGLAGLVELDEDGDDASAIKGTLDVIVKGFGFTGLLAAYVVSSQSGPSFADRALQGAGGHLQLGYLIEHTVQPLFRYTLVAFHQQDRRIHELTAGGRISLWDDGVALVLEGAWLYRDGRPLPQELQPGEPDYRVGALLQLRI